MTKLQTLFAALDCALTGKPWREVQTNARHAAVTLEKLMNGDRLYYLSDSGYSRVRVTLIEPNYTTVELYLAHEPLPTAKSNWPICCALRCLVESELNRLIDITLD